MKYAFAVPIPSDKLEQFRNLFDETMGPRRQEFDDFQRRQRVVAEDYFLQSSPEGSILLVYGEGDLRPIAEIYDEDNPFDRWIRQQMLDITGFDIVQLEAQPSDLLVEWRGS